MRRTTAGVFNPPPPANYRTNPSRTIGVVVPVVSEMHKTDVIAAERQTVQSGIMDEAHRPAPSEPQKEMCSWVQAVYSLVCHHASLDYSCLPVPRGAS